MDTHLSMQSTKPVDLFIELLLLRPRGSGVHHLHRPSWLPTRIPLPKDGLYGTLGQQICEMTSRSAYDFHGELQRQPLYPPSDVHDLIRAASEAAAKSTFEPPISTVGDLTMSPPLIFEIVIDSLVHRWSTKWISCGLFASRITNGCGRAAERMTATPLGCTAHPARCAFI